jgi:signal transduction histidine kinase
VNEACEKLFNRPAGQCIGRSDDQLWNKSAAQRQREGDRKVASIKKAVETTETISKPDGLHYWLATRFPILNEQGATMMIGVAAIDITERKRLEREIQEISEREKRKIGQDLHDGLGQYLTGIACMARALQQRLEDRQRPEALDVAKIANLVNQTIAQARDLARGLCPVELETNGLQGALNDLADQIEKFFNVKCTFECPVPIVVTDSAVAINLYRIAQEATNNAIKHGQAAAILIRLVAGPGSALLTIKDNGSGFLKGFVQSKGLGLRVMHYRAGMIGASISIEADPKGGTIVSCGFPYQGDVSKQPHRARTVRTDRLPAAP